MNRPDPAQPNPTITHLTALIWKTIKVRISICDYQNFEIIYRMQQSGILLKRTTFFKFPDFCIPDLFVPKTNEVRNLKRTPKVAHIIHM